VQDLISSLGPVCAVIGAQWGDEGKGKVTDIVAQHYDVIARACGGANAGHTIVVDGKQTIFHLVPSGALHEGKEIVLGSGMVLHLPTLLEEIAVLRELGIDIVPHLSISHEAHILFDYHKELDQVQERERTQAKGEGIGTTKRGIGPAYVDKASRTGFRMESLGDDLQGEITNHVSSLQNKYGVNVDVAKELEELQKAKKLLSGCVKDTTKLLYGFLANDKTVLIEGAQGTLLDLDHGSYPYVTSSSTTVSGALQGLGLPPRVLHSCIGVAKAYCTRVGGGGFPNEAKEEDANRLRERGGEYGATTGRPRRCGWLSIPDLIKATMLNGFSHWNITKLDVLDEEEKIPVVVDAKEGGELTYEELPGWKSSTKGLTSFDDLPENAKAYIGFIEGKTGVPVSFIGTGQGREEMIVKY